MRKILLVVGLVAALALAAASVSSGVIRPDLTEGGAKSETWYYARYVDWTWGAEYPYTCHGPYENVKGRTQWACYGEFEANGHAWQVNVDPYGSQTYHALTR